MTAKACWPTSPSGAMFVDLRLGDEFLDLDGSLAFKRYGLEFLGIKLNVPAQQLRQLWRRCAGPRRG